MRWILPALLSVCVGLALHAADDPLPAILKAFASEDFTTREAAQADLTKLPPTRLNELITLAEREPDEEVKTRLWRGIETIARGKLIGDIDRSNWPHITGRLVDKSGKPVERAHILVYGQTMAELAQAFQYDQWINPDGTFDLRVPFTDVPTTLEAQPGNNVIRVMPGIPMGDWTVNGSEERTVTGSIVDQAGKPFQGQEVKLIGENGFETSANTDEAGKVEWRVNDHFGQSIAYARTGDQMIAQQILRAGLQKAMNFKFAPSGILYGTLRDKRTGKGIKGMKITVMPAFMNGFRLYATSGDSGEYEIKDIPAGRYWVIAQGAGYEIASPRPNSFSQFPQVTTIRGGRQEGRIDVEPQSLIIGRVVDLSGKPVPGALVTCPSVWVANVIQSSYVACDAMGRFILPAGNATKSLQVTAYSPHHGRGQINLEDVTGGTAKAGVEIKLTGAMRIKGIVVNKDGEPVKDALINGGAWNQTGADGRFDMGWVATAQEELTVSVQPRVPVWNEGGEGEYVVKSRETAPVFYNRREARVTGTFGKDVEVRVEVERGKLVELSGKVEDAAGKTLDRVPVCILTSNAEGENWLWLVVPDRGLRGGGGFVTTQMPQQVRQVRTDAEGKWRVFVLAEELELQGEKTGKFCVGVYAPRGGWKLEREIGIPEASKEINIKMDK